MKFLFIILNLILSTALFSQVDTLLSSVSKWDKLNLSMEQGIEKREIMAGNALELENVAVYSETIQTGMTVHKQNHSEFEELIIIKDGRLKISVNEESKVLGPGSVALIFPKDKHSIQNDSGEPATFYSFNYKARIAPVFTRGEEAGGSFMIDWDDLDYNKSAIGGRRDYFHRATAMLNNFEMHVSTLNEGLTNHKAHTHKAEEFVLMIKGDVVMLIGEENYDCSAGDVVFVSSMVPHSLNNTGKGETMYFAFQLWQ